MVSRLEPDSYGEPSRSNSTDRSQNRITTLLKHLFPHASHTTTHIHPIPVWGRQPQRPAKPVPQPPQPPRPQAPLARPQPQPHPRPQQDVYSRVRELTKSHLPPKKSSVRVIPNPGQQPAPPPPPKTPADPPKEANSTPPKNPIDPQPKKEPITSASNSSQETLPSTPVVDPNEPLDSSEAKQPMMTFELPGTKLARGCIGGINGIGTDLTAAMSQADYLKQLIGNYHIEWVHNRTQSLPKDIAQTIILSFGGISTPAEQLQAQWKSFHEKHKNDPEAKYFQICHSQGALHVRNALLSAPPDIRNRVIVLAIAPAIIVPKSLCFNSFNYTSRRDPIPYGQTAALLALEGPSASILKKMFEVARELIPLDPHPEAFRIDHSFKSPTFKAKIQDHIKEYIQQAGADSSKTA